MINKSSLESLTETFNDIGSDNDHDLAGWVESTKHVANVCKSCGAEVFIYFGASKEVTTQHHSALHVDVKFINKCEAHL